MQNENKSEIDKEPGTVVKTEPPESDPPIKSESSNTAAGVLAPLCSDSVGYGVLHVCSPSYFL